MNKAEVAAYFDALAPTWDKHMITDNGKLNAILDAAGVRNGVTVLEVSPKGGLSHGLR